MTTIKNATVGEVIKAVADRYRADVLICHVDAYHESAFNPEAVGDNGTSFGLYQLHKGGELGNMSPAAARNPLFNARVAIPVIAAVEHDHPNWSPGQVAAAAQRPADEIAYATAINDLYDEIKAGRPPVGYLAARNKTTGLTITDPDDGK